MSGSVKNTDRELYREDTGDPAGSFYENSVHVTESGSIGMNVGGTVIVQPIADWHAQAGAAHFAALGAAAAPSLAADNVARRFHEAYERLAPSCGYETRRESAVPWEDVPLANRRLMRAVCSEVIAPLLDRIHDGGAEEKVRDALLKHHPIAHTTTGPLKGCRCGQVRLGEDVIAHVVEQLRAAFATQAGDEP